MRERKIQAGEVFSMLLYLAKEKKMRVTHIYIGQEVYARTLRKSLL